MKTKIILLLSIISGYSANVFAQYGYAGINLGYGMGLPAYSLGYSTEAGSTGTTFTLEKGTYGQGLNFGITGGYMFNENIGAELGVSYLIGSKKEFTTSTFDIDTSSFAVTESEGTITLDEIKMIRLNPAMKITFGDEVRPYLRMGIIIGFGTGYTRTEESVVTITGSAFDDTTTIEMATEYSGGASFGFNSALGVDFDLTDNLTLFGELFFTSLSWAPTKSTITKFMYDGTDFTANATPGSLDTSYEDEYTQSIIPPIPGAPVSNKSLKTYLPFGSFGINAGVMFTFGK